MGGQRRVDELAAPLRDAKGSPEQRLRRGRAEADDDLGLDRRDLRLEPGVAGLDLPRPRLAVQPPLAALHPFEMLDGVGDVDAPAIDPGLGERAVEQAAGGTDERLTLEIL